MVGAIILNYRNYSDTRKCIGFLQRQQGVDLRIIVVDNASGPEESARLAAFCREEGVDFIASPENRGYNAGNNLGLRLAVDSGAEYVLVANPDMEFPDPHYVSRLVAEMQAFPEAAVVASDIIDTSGRHQNPMLPEGGWRDSFGWVRSLLRRGDDKDSYSFVGDHEKSSECFKVSGCALLIRSEFLKEVGYFDEYPFLYCEESILSRQVAKVGRRMRYVSGVTAFHRHVNSEKGDPRPRYRHWRRSRLYFIRRYSGWPLYGRVLSALSWRLYMRLMITAFTLRKALRK